ncbi:isochorismatase family protein [Methanococcoides sp. SA1]|nr:isochorismatase family protein [Methanococcoides sp. SA1]
MAKGKVGMLTVDMQPGCFLNAESEDCSGFIWSYTAFLQEARSFFSEDDFWFKEWPNIGKTLLPLRWAGRYSPERVVETNYRDAFKVTDLADKLRSLSELVIGGTCACKCVRKTIEGAIENGYDVVTSPDLVIKTSNDNFDYIDTYLKVGARVLENKKEVLKYVASRNR